MLVWRCGALRRGWCLVSAAEAEPRGAVHAARLALGATTRQGVVAMALVVFGVPAIAAGPDYQAINQALAKRVILPAHEAWASAAADLPTTLNALCAEPSATGLENAQAAFQSVMDAWQAVQPVAFGPIAEAATRASVQFWPDKHGTATRQLNQALADQDPVLLDNLANQSVGLQNLQALEVLLFGVDLLGDEPKATYACRLAAAIGERQAELAGEVVGAWQAGFFEAFVTAGAGNDAYFDASEATTELFRAMTQSLDEIIALKLERPLGESLEDARPRRAESWRSERSLANIQQNLETIEALYRTPGGFRSWLVDDRPPLHATAVEVFTAVRHAVHAIDLPLEAAVQNETERAKVEALRSKLQVLRTPINGTIAMVGGITIGFNAMDGD